MRDILEEGFRAKEGPTDAGMECLILGQWSLCDHHFLHINEDTILLESLDCLQTSLCLNVNHSTVILCRRHTLFSPSHTVNALTEPETVSKCKNVNVTVDCLGIVLKSDSCTYSTVCFTVWPLLLWPQEVFTPLFIPMYMLRFYSKIVFIFLFILFYKNLPSVLDSR